MNNLIAKIQKIDINSVRKIAFDFTGVLLGVVIGAAMAILIISFTA